MSIAILCPTRGRPEQLARMNESRGNIAKLYVAYGDWAKDFHDYVDFHYVRKFHENVPTAQKWNILAIKAMEDPSVKLFMLGSDDMYFGTVGWDKALLDHYNALENKVHVYHLADSRDPSGTPHPIVTREYIEAMGYFLPPIFLHWYVDSWTVEIAKANECFTHMKDYLLVHDKPSDRGEADETHSRIRQWGWLERDAYVNERCGHFLELEKQRLARAINE